MKPSRNKVLLDIIKHNGNCDSEHCNGCPYEQGRNCLVNKHANEYHKSNHIDYTKAKYIVATMMYMKLKKGNSVDLLDALV